MNLVGKILTVVNLLLACLFFAFAGATLNAKNQVQAKVASLDTQVKTEQSKRATAEQKVGAADAKTKNATILYDAEAKKYIAAKTDAEKQQEGLMDEVNGLRKEVAVTNTKLLQAAEETVFRKQEVEEYRKSETELNKQLKERGKELADTRDQLALARNEIEVLKDRTRTLAANEHAFRRILADKGINVPADPKELEAKIEGNLPTPEVTGKIVDAVGKLATVALGENDNLRPGMKLDAWRTAPLPKYLGEVTVFLVEPKRCVVMGISLVAPLEAGDSVGKSPLLNR